MNAPKVTESPKVCPFCGGNFSQVLGHNEISQIDTYRVLVGFVAICDAERGGCGADAGFSETQEGALDKWNRRRPDAAREARVVAAETKVAGFNAALAISQKRIAELEKALEAMLDDYRTDGCPWPDCVTCRKSKWAYSKARAALANTQESQT